jgi:murein DD-endopeptidase MepM/ murein hydrolase activator NlpD
VVAGTLCVAMLAVAGVAAGIHYAHHTPVLHQSGSLARMASGKEHKNRGAAAPEQLTADQTQEHAQKSPKTAPYNPLILALKPGRPSAPAYDSVTEPAAQPAPPAKTEHFKLTHPVSISTFLREAGLSFSQQSAWSEAFRSSAHSPVLRPGHQIALLKDPNNGELRGLRYDVDDMTSIIERSLGAGVVFASRQPLTYVPHTVTATVPVKPNLDAVAKRDHLPVSILDRLKNIFGSHLAKPGTIVKLAYKELVTPDGTHHRDADLEAAEVKAGTRQFQAFNFRDDHGHEHVYDASGHPLGPQFLRYPVKFSYISSTFSESRYHPILHIFRPHVGVDLAARYGTPVKAAGDGTVEFAGWDGELGRCIKIRHANDLISVYGHLSRIAPSIQPGVTVKLGQEIGNVGASGLATGPHLHFALYKEGRFLNPLTVKLDDAPPIPSDQMADFAGFKDHWENVLAKLPNVTTLPQGTASAPIPAWGNTTDSRLAVAEPDVRTVSLGATVPHSRSAHHRHRHRYHARHAHRLATTDTVTGGADTGSM